MKEKRDAWLMAVLLISWQTSPTAGLAGGRLPSDAGRGFVSRAVWRGPVSVLHQQPAALGCWDDAWRRRTAEAAAGGCFSALTVFVGCRQEVDAGSVRSKKLPVIRCLHPSSPTHQPLRLFAARLWCLSLELEYLWFVGCWLGEWVI